MDPSTTHVGAVLERLPGPKYRAVLDFAELDLPAPLPRAATLKKWRAEADGLVVALVAPRDAIESPRGPLRLDEGVEAALEWLGRAADALAATCVVVATGKEVTTGQRDRDRLARWLDRLPKIDGRSIVWSPSGLWDPVKALAFADKHGLVCAFDPLEQAPPPSSVVYCRIRGMGGRKRISEGMLHRVRDALESAGAVRSFVSIESDRSFREAQLLRKLIEEPAPR